MAACSGGGNTEHGRQPQPGDTLYSVDAAMRIYGTDPQRALDIIDSGFAVGNINEKQAMFFRAKILGQTTEERRLDSAYFLLDALIKSDFVNTDNNRQVVLDLLVSVSRMRDDNVSYLRWATEKVDFCRAHGLETEALRTEAEIGVILASMGDEEKGLAKLSGVISALDRQRHFNEMDACIIALKRKISVLSELGRADEVVELAKRIEEKINDYRLHPNDYDDGTYRVPTDEDQRISYCNFYIAQAHGFLAYAYAERWMEEDAGYLKDSAHHYLALFNSSDYSRTLSGKFIIAPVYQMLGEYDKMLPLYDEAVRQFGNDTINSNYAKMLYGRAKAAEAYGNQRAAINYLHRYISLNNQLNKNLLNARAYEYAARFQLQEEQTQLESEKQKAKGNRMLAIFLSVIVFLSICFIICLLLERREMGRKNHALIEQIADANKVRTENEKLRNENASNAQSEIKTITQSDIDSYNDEELFAFLSDTIRSEKLFKNPNFGRQTLSDRFNLTDHRIGAAFARGSEYNSLPEFVRKLRLDYACQLLSDRPDMSINDVAADSGFNSSTVFCRYFKNKYEVTPSELRKQLSQP